jgi:hypothetical protein
MQAGKTIFTQLMDFIPAHEFRRCVNRYDGNYKVSTFTCWDQFLCLAFAQLTGRESLREIEICLRALGPRLYHCGVRGHVSRSTLADANETRDYRIYADLAQVLITTARSLYAHESFGVELQQTVYALDCTTLDLCLSLFPWARYRSQNAAVKMHTLLDLQGNIPAVIAVQPAKTHENHMLDELFPMSQILSLSLFEKSPLLQAFSQVNSLDEPGHSNLLSAMCFARSTGLSIGYSQKPPGLH